MAAPVVVVTQEENTEESAEPPDPPERCTSRPALILLLYSVIESLDRGVADDLVTDLETISTAQALAEALRSRHYQVVTAPIRCEEDVLTAVDGMDPRTTLIFNQVEALNGIPDGEPRVPRLLDRLGFCYVGNTFDSLDACHDKARTKARLLRHGVPTAPYQVFRTPGAPIRVPLPAIIKPVAEDCSLGIDRNAVVYDARSLRQRVAYILEVYKQPALAEMFLPGREFNVSVWGNGTAHVLPIAEGDFSGWEAPLCVMSFDAKWNAGSEEYYAFTTHCPAVLESAMEERIRQVALGAYHTMRCRDYARVDMREKDGEIYVLEVNPNPCLAPDSGFVNTARVAGYDYARMAEQLVRWAWMRHHRERVSARQKLTQVRPAQLDAS